MELPVLKIILMGNPNVGKSVVFSRLTGIEVISSNYPGTTVEYALGRTSIAGESAEVIDPPGVYSLEPSCRAEEVTREIFEEGADVVVDVVDATNLERNLNLTLQILERGLPTVVVLNLWDVATRTGIEIDLATLEEELGVPVVPAVAVSGQGIRELAEAIPRARVPPPAIRGEVRWFAAEMERKLRLNDRRGGWAESHQDWLLDRLRAEARELDGALQSGGTYKIIDEAADVANFAMMIADNARRRAGDAPKED